MRTTLSKIRKHHPCKEGWEKLLRHLNKTQPDDEPLPLETILDANGLGDALWCLQAVEGHDREMRLYAVWCARQIQHLTTDPRSVAALDVAERYARGQASLEEMEAASAAWEAERAAAWVAALDVAERYARGQASLEEMEAASEAARATESAAWAAARGEMEVTVDAQGAEFRRVCREIEAGRDPYPMETKP